MLGKGDLMA